MQSYDRVSNSDEFIIATSENILKTPRKNAIKRINLYKMVDNRNQYMIKWIQTREIFFLLEKHDIQVIVSEDVLTAINNQNSNMIAKWTEINRKRTIPETFPISRLI